MLHNSGNELNYTKSHITFKKNLFTRQLMNLYHLHLQHKGTYNKLIIPIKFIVEDGDR